MQYKPGVNIVPFLPTPGKLRTTTKTLESYYAGPQLDTIQIEELRAMGKKLQDDPKYAKRSKLLEIPNPS